MRALRSWISWSRTGLLPWPAYGPVRSTDYSGIVLGLLQKSVPTGNSIADFSAHPGKDSTSKRVWSRAETWGGPGIWTDSRHLFISGCSVFLCRTRASPRPPLPAPKLYFHLLLMDTPRGWFWLLQHWVCSSGLPHRCLLSAHWEGLHQLCHYSARSPQTLYSLCKGHLCWDHQQWGRGQHSHHDWS